MADENKPKGTPEPPPRGIQQGEAAKPTDPKSPLIGEGSGQDAIAGPSAPASDKPVTFGSQGMAPGKTGDIAEGKDPKKVPAEPPMVPAKDAAAQEALKKEAEIAKSAPPKPPTGAAPQPAVPASKAPPVGAGTDAAGTITGAAAAGTTEQPGGAKPAAAKPAAPVKPEGAPAKPAGPTPQPWNSEMVQRFQQRYGSGIREAVTYMGQPYMVVDASIAYEVLEWMRDEEQFDYCVDITAVHYPTREKPFEVVWILYSFPRNQRVRIKASYGENENAPSVVSIWSTANWLEREVYDMFGVKFDGHPNLTRILLPEDWKGYPLRKDYGIIQQDKEWVQIHLGIESGQ